MASTGNGRRCKATTRSGKPCQAWAVEESDFCFWHDPGRAHERRAARRRGGHARHGRHIGPTGDVEPVTITSARDTLPILAEAVNDLQALENSVSRARAIGYLCGQVIKAFEVTELQARVEALESALARRGG